MKKSYSLSKVCSIKKIGIRPTRDLEVNSPDHNFVAEGLVCSNSHAVCYAMLAYKTAWAKAHYPTEFFCALLRKANCGNKEETEQILTFVNDAKLFDIEVLPPDVEGSGLDFEVVCPGKISFGLGHIKGIGSSSRNDIKKCRVGSCQKLKLAMLEDSPPKKTVFEGLLWSGAFDHYKDRWSIWGDFLVASNLTPNEKLIAWEVVAERDLSIFEAATDLKNGKLNYLYDKHGKRPPTDRRLDALHDLLLNADREMTNGTIRRLIQRERFYMGVVFTEDPNYQYKGRNYNDCIEFVDVRDGRSLLLICTIEKVREHWDKNGNKMAFITLSDSTYMIEGGVVFASTMKRYEHSVVEGAMVEVSGKKQGNSLIVNKIEIC